MALPTERYSEKIAGVISCYDRVLLQGTLPGLCYPDGMTKYLGAHDIRVFDYARFAEPLRDQIRENSEQIAAEHGLQIEFVRSHSTRKEAIIEKILKQRGTHPGLVHVLSSMEMCRTYKPWHDKLTHRTFLKPDQSKAQQLSDSFDVTQLHPRLDQLAARYCPVIADLGVTYHWSVMQVEYATDIVFKRQGDLADLYEQLTRTAIHAVKPENVASFLGRTLHGNFEDELGNRFDTRISGTRLKHQMGPASIKVYDKFSLTLPYRYYLTSVGRRVILAGLKFKELFLIPALAAEPQA